MVEDKKRHISGNKRKPLSEEHKRKISESSKGKIFSEETRRKLSDVLKGIKRPYNMGENNPAKRPEVRDKISKALKGRDCYWSRGKQRSKETKLKISKKNSGSGNTAWRGGVAKNRKYGVGFNDYLKNKIRKRDNYICQICGEIQNNKINTLNIHHIDYNKQNNSKLNLISLCHSCHSKTNHKRVYWEHLLSKSKNITKSE